jgi:hypothetical protein
MRIRWPGASGGPHQRWPLEVSSPKRRLPFGDHAEDMHGRHHRDIRHSRDCGLDGHAITVVACRCVGGERPMRTGSPLPEALVQRANGLLAAGGPPLAIERTGVLWRPVCKLRAAYCTVLLVKASFIAPRPIRAWRNVTRHRQRLVCDRAARSLSVSTTSWHRPRLRVDKSRPTCLACPTGSCARRLPRGKRLRRHSPSWPRIHSRPWRRHASRHWEAPGLRPNASASHHGDPKTHPETRRVAARPRTFTDSVTRVPLRLGSSPSPSANPSRAWASAWRNR